MYWALSIKPDDWTNVVEDVWCLHTDPVGDAPRYLVYYRFDENEVTLLHIEEV